MSTPLLSLSPSLEALLAESFTHLVTSSPTGQVAHSSHEESALLQQARRVFEAAIAPSQPPREDLEALINSIHELSQSANLKEALSGNLVHISSLGELWVLSYLQRQPWGLISERELWSLWFEWVSLLGDAAHAHGEALWVSIPAVKMPRWQELGLEQQLAHLWEDWTENEPRLMGLQLSGLGKSAHLAYTRRWFLAHGLAVTWLDVEGARRASGRPRGASWPGTGPRPP